MHSNAKRNLAKIHYWSFFDWKIKMRMDDFARMIWLKALPCGKVETNAKPETESDQPKRNLYQYSCEKKMIMGTGYYTKRTEMVGKTGVHAPSKIVIIISHTIFTSGIHYEHCYTVYLVCLVALQVSFTFY